MNPFAAVPEMPKALSGTAVVVLFPAKQQTRLSWPGLIGPSIQKAEISVDYWMAGSSPAMTTAALADEALFNRAFVDYGAVSWPGEINIALDPMHAEIKKSGACVKGPPGNVNIGFISYGAPPW